MNKKSLAGKKILITRTREQSGDFATRLKKLGAEVIEFPTIEIVPPIRWSELDQAIDQLKLYDWVLFTFTKPASLWASSASTMRSEIVRPGRSGE